MYLAGVHAEEKQHILHQQAALLSYLLPGQNNINMSSSLQMRSTVYDSDSDSDFDNPLSEETKEPEYSDDCPWRSVVDPASGKTYYYHAETRETQWNKPSEMASREEKEALAAKERKQKDFFAAMEANIMQSIAQGFKAPEKKNRLDVEFENKPISDDPLAVSNRSTSSRRQLSPQRARLTRGTSGSSQRSHRSIARPNLIRTISSMDSAYLSDLICRVPSSRHVTGRPMGNTSTSSRSIGLGSSHHSTRSGARMPRSLPKRSLVAPAKSKAEDNKQAHDDDDDDGPPPLTVVTTPDLRTGLSKRESLGMDALISGPDVAKPNLERGTSLTLAEISGPSFHGNLGIKGGSSNLMGSSWLDQSATSRLNTSDHSIRLGPHGSEASLGAGFMGGSFNNSSTPDLLNNCSFNSFESSDASFSGLNSSHNGGLSVASSSLLPVRESMNESPSNPRLSLDNVVLEGDNEDDDTPEEASFSLGGDGDLNDDQITSNWLDALPQDSAANNEDMVGYGNDAKRFSDAGFTSFFDESMANFDLSDKETKALQKLAFISEEMTKVAEGEEDSSEDTEEDDSSDLGLGDEDGQQEFPLFFGSEEEAAVTEEEDPSSEDSNHSPVTPSFPPAFKTPTVSRKSNTAVTASKPEPSRAPAKRTLGPRNTRVSRAQRNLLISATDDSSDEEEATAPAPAPASNLPVRNLALAAATLTIDNARSHSTNHFNEPSSNAASAAAAQSFRQGRMARRHTGDASVSTLRSSQTDGRPTLEKQSGSQGNLQVHNAARRLSMFKLKNIDRSKLRSTHGGKGGLAQALATEDKAPDIKRSGTTGAPVKAKEEPANRPNLVRRNTCGTLYVGTTMSAPDKDATIKCVCGVFRAHILQCERDQDVEISPKFRIFNDLESQQGTARVGRINNSSRRAPSASSVPSLEQITTFYRDVFQRAQMEYDCIIISLIYVERLVKTTKGALRPRAENWRSILFSCMVLASKVWDDLSMWNADFSATCPTGVKFPLKRINELELAILSALSYRVKVPASEYAKYYFLLRSMLIKSGLVGDNVDTTTPLDVEGARRLQQVSKEFQSGMGETRRKIRKAKSMRSKSMGEDERVRVMTGAKRVREKNKKVSLEHVVTM